MALDQEYESARNTAVQAVENLLQASGLRRPDMLLADVVVIASQRGYVEEGGTSLTVSMVPTDTTAYAAMGMLRQSTIEFDERAAGRDRWTEDRDDG